MPEKRMLILPAELVKKIDDNRGDMAQAEFIEYLIDIQFGEKVKENKQFATKEEMRSFEDDMKKLLKSFLDFFVSYGLEIGNGEPKTELGELTTKLHSLESGLASEEKKGEAKIKWK